MAHEMIHAWQVDRGDLVGRKWQGEDMSHLPYQFQPWELEAHGSQDKVAEYFFSDRLPTKAELDEIKHQTDSVFEEIVDAAKSANIRSKLKKAGAFAATVGLGALIGF